MQQQIELIITSDGSHSIHVPELNEHYHSIHGAVQESMIVFIQNGYDCCKAEEINILEIGFGTGLNALLTLARAFDDKRKVNYTTIEKYPLEKEITDKLNYDMYVGKRLKGMLGIIHSAPWENTNKITDSFALTKLRSDFISGDISGNYNLIYYDAFGPDKQPEMWEEPLFRKIESVTNPGALFVTYSAKGTVRRLLRSCGFEVSLVPGPPGKREMIQAVKI
jgi:tRNA U34 5-methylaminomethyl-2-thiouridine-forming methyltransferase MnmC